MKVSRQRRGTILVAAKSPFSMKVFISFQIVRLFIRSRLVKRIGRCGSRYYYPISWPSFFSFRKVMFFGNVSILTSLAWLLSTLIVACVRWKFCARIVRFKHGELKKLEPFVSSVPLFIHCEEIESFPITSSTALPSLSVVFSLTIGLSTLSSSSSSSSGRGGKSSSS